MLGRGGLTAREGPQVWIVGRGGLTARKGTSGMDSARGGLVFVTFHCM